MMRHVKRIVLLSIIVAGCLGPGCKESNEDKPASAPGEVGEEVEAPAAGQPEKSPEAKGAKNVPQAELLPIGEGIPVMKPLTDLKAIADKRSPWDNYALEDELSEKYISQGKTAPFPGSKVYPRYKENFVASILEKGAVDFKVVGNLYRDGILSREKASKIAADCYKKIEEKGADPAMKANLVIGMIHVGYEEEAFKAIALYRNEPWFSKNWDVNFFAGTLFFRHRRFEESLPFFEAANEIESSLWVRLWLRMALGNDKSPEAKMRRDKLFKFGKHMGPGTGEGFPFDEKADFFGIRRWHLAGAIAFGDYNNDTFVDFVAQGVYAEPELYLFENGRGYVRKEDKTLAGVSNTPPACVAADFNNDGFTDLYMTRAAWLSAGPNRMLKNDGGKGFVDVSEKGDAALAWQNSCGASALDFDQDGLLDLAVTGTAGGRLALLKNMGNFEFKDVSLEAGIEENKAVTVGVSTGDVNGDGWTDIFVNSLSPADGPKRKYEAPNGLYINNMDGTFTNEAEKRGVAEGTSFGFATWMFDYDNDGDLDIFASNFVEGDLAVLDGYITEREWVGTLYGGPALYKNDGKGFFKNIGKSAGFVPASVMGAQFVDMDLDGDQDVFLGPGSHPLRDMQPLFVYRNNGDDTFTNVTPHDDPRYVGKFHGMAFADMDRDGDPDMIVNNGGIQLNDRFRDLVLENQTTGKQWIHIRLKGTKSNAGGIGARVTVEYGGKQLLQEVSAGEGFSSTNTPYLVFGLNDATQADSVRIEWMSGKVQTLGPIAANQGVIIEEGKETPTRIY